MKTSTILFGASASIVSVFAFAFAARRNQEESEPPKFIRDLPPSPAERATGIPSYPVAVDFGLTPQRPNMSMASAPPPASTSVDWGLTPPRPNFTPGLPATTKAPGNAVAPALTMPASAAAPAARTTPSAPARTATPAAAPNSSTRAPSDAARELYSLVVPLIRDGNLDALGTNAQPSQAIAILQRDMRVIKSDGIYGPKTAARGKELLGREFPPRTAPANRRVSATPATPAPQAPKVAIRYSPEQAAEALYLLVTHPPVDWGSKKLPNSLIEAAQHDMGELVADGVYGPKTQARGTKLTGHKFPARS
jgi:hypothetical protein